MDTSASTQEHAPRGASARAQTVVQRDHERLVLLLILSGLATWVVIGYAIYALIAAAV
jgi:hypothetical protein